MQVVEFQERHPVQHGLHCGDREEVPRHIQQVAAIGVARGVRDVYGGDAVRLLPRELTQGLRSIEEPGLAARRDGGAVRAHTQTVAFWSHPCERFEPKSGDAVGRENVSFDDGHGGGKGE